MKMKLINRLKILNDYLGRKTRVSGLPLELVIEATNRCNLNCVMCVRKNMKRPVGAMRFSLYKKIIDEVSPYMELVYLHGVGEPLFHPRIFEMIKYGKAKNLTMGLSTNATLLSREKAQGLLSSGLDYLIISIDATTPETYLKIRGGKNFQSVVKNTREYLRLKKKAKKAPFTVLQFIKTDLNKGEAGRFRKMWQGKGADVVRIKPVIDLLRQEGNKLKEPGRPCFYIWRQLNLVSWDGKIVTPCCMDSEGDYSLGDANKNTLTEIWNSPKMITLRRLQASGGWKNLPFCRNCNYPQPSFSAKVGALIIPGIIVKKILPYLEKTFLKEFSLYD